MGGISLLNHGLTTNDIIPHLKSILATFDIPEKVMFNGGPQFSLFAFQDFAKHYRFRCTISSLRYAQSNGKAEKAVQTIKNLLKKSHNLYLALLAYQTSLLSLVTVQLNC